jgi:succinoglycan biosynthesis protein ExoA
MNNFQPRNDGALDASVHLPFISVVIPTLNEEAFIADTLQQLAEQEYPPNLLEILVVDGGSTDQTTAMVLQFIGGTSIRVRLLENPRRYSSSARNMAIKQAYGEFILFLDAHVYLPGKRIIFDMAIAARRNNALVLGRAQPLNPPGIKRIQHAIASVRASLIGHSKESYIFSSCEGWVSPLSIAVMYHRSVLLEMNGFDESFDAAEDLEFNFRLERSGIKAFISPAFTVQYYPRENFSDLYAQMYRYGFGRAKFTCKHPERFSYELLVPCLFSISLIVMPMIAFTYNLSMLFAGITMYGVSVAALTYAATRRFKWSDFLLSPACLAVIQIGLASGVVKGLMAALISGLKSKSATIPAPSAHNFDCMEIDFDGAEIENRLS